MNTIKTYIEISQRKDGTTRGQIMLGRNCDGVGIYAPIDVEGAVEAFEAGNVTLVKRTRVIGQLRIPTLQTGLVEVDVEEGPIVCSVLAARPIKQSRFSDMLKRVKTVDGGDVIVNARQTTPAATAVEAE